MGGGKVVNISRPFNFGGAQDAMDMGSTLLEDVGMDSGGYGWQERMDG